MLAGWEHRHLDNTSMWYWLNQVPGFGDVLREECFRIDKPAKRSNLIRIALLGHFGGVWLDYHIILI